MIHETPALVRRPPALASQATRSSPQATRSSPQGTRSSPQATRKGWPYYIRRLPRPNGYLAYSRATPCGWPAAAPGTLWADIFLYLLAYPCSSGAIRSLLSDK
jgi:hypothetical protein